MKKLVNSFSDIKFYDDELEKAKRYFTITEEELQDDEDIQKFNAGIERASDLEELVEVLNDYTDILDNGSSYSVERIITSIYDYSIKEILSVTNMSAYDIQRHAETATLYSIEDYIQNLADCGCLEEDVEDFAEALRTGSYSGDIESGVYEGFDYVIEYRL